MPYFTLGLPANEHLCSIISAYLPPPIPCRSSYAYTKLYLLYRMRPRLQRPYNNPCLNPPQSSHMADCNFRQVFCSAFLSFYQPLSYYLNIADLSSRSAQRLMYHYLAVRQRKPFPFVPELSKNAPMLHAIPIHMVDTSHFIYFIVS